MLKTTAPLPPRHRAYPRGHPLPVPPATSRAGHTWSRAVPPGRRFPRR